MASIIETKRFKFGLDQNPQAGGGSTSHFGSDVQPKVEVTYHVAPYEGRSWTHMLPQHSLLFHKGLLSDNVKGFHNAYENHQYVYLLTIIHVNGIVADQFIKFCNQWITETSDGMNKKRFDEIDYPEKLREIADEWKMAGVCVTTPKEDAPIGGQIYRERDVVVWVRGDDKIFNYWGATLAGGDHCFLVWTFLEVRHPRPQFAFSSSERLTCDAFTTSSPQKYVPTLVAIHYHEPTLPLRLKTYMVNGKKYVSPHVHYVGQCVLNSGFNRQAGLATTPAQAMTKLMNAMEIQSRPKVDMLYFC
jgi:hypothetical protein